MTVQVSLETRPRLARIGNKRTGRYRNSARFYIDAALEAKVKKLPVQRGNKVAKKHEPVKETTGSAAQFLGSTPRRYK